MREREKSERREGERECVYFFVNRFVHRRLTELHVIVLAHMQGTY